MLPLKNNPILTDYQVEILRIFFSSHLGKQFFLTGGTALSAFYLAHRLSKDLDLFTIDQFDTLELEKLIEQIAKNVHATVRTKVKSQTYNEVYLEHTRQRWVQRIDIVVEQPVLFGERKNVDLITIDSLENIGSNKILTIYSRIEPKDYIDLYFICKTTATDFFALFEKTKKKDLGLDEFYFANMIAEVERLREFPKVLKPFSRDDLVDFFLNLSNMLFKKIKPGK